MMDNFTSYLCIVKERHKSEMKTGRTVYSIEDKLHYEVYECILLKDVYHCVRMMGQSCLERLC